VTEILLALVPWAVTNEWRQGYEPVTVLTSCGGDVGSRRDQAVEAYNKSVVTLESRVLVSARRLRGLTAAPSVMEIESLEPETPRTEAAGTLDSALNRYRRNASTEIE
jgi:hypothetical protein